MISISGSAMLMAAIQAKMELKVGGTVIEIASLEMGASGKAGGKAAAKKVLYKVSMKASGRVSVSASVLRRSIIVMGRAQGIRISSKEIRGLYVSGSSIKCACSTRVYLVIKAKMAIKISAGRTIKLSKCTKGGKAKGKGKGKGKSGSGSGSKGKSGSGGKSG